MYFLSNNARKAFILLTISFLFPAIAATAQTVVNNKEVYTSVAKVGKNAKGIKAFYASTNYKPIWVGSKNKARRKALLASLKSSGNHGLPTARYKIDKLESALKSARGKQNVGSAELLATKTYLQYAHDLTSGAVNPKKIDPELAVNRPRRSDEKLLAAFAKSSPAGFLKSLQPKTKEYQKLLVEKKKLERALGASAGIQSIPSRTLKKGSSSNSVILLRQRLTKLGYGKLGNAPLFDDGLKTAVQKFQTANGLNPDGVAGPGTIGRLNQGPKDKLVKVLVNLERERWMNFPRGDRNVFVNLASYTVYLMDNGRSSFETRAVIGKRAKDRTPEFYDEMTHMVINPTWHVPRSIAGKEYLPIIRKDPSFLKRRNMVMISQSGKSVSPASVDLSGYNEKNFPYYIKQRPDPQNALGLVKFMFPNKYNIYLHDTPSKSLFNREVRAFSHGCVRLQKPFDFAYKLLEKQTSNPKGAFHTFLDTKKEQYVNLAKPVPVYLTYRTAYFGDASAVSFYPDIYGRDKKVFNALSKAGVSLRAVQS
ncbi:L,D-transpeptidase family protein [Amylibacter sp. SFDW26]|uniref:L,D-transpeptidase family protein n=1 Tax=Amylibacter sp. SFDW26 TaxID=2652722 RepID=UPI0012617D5C|nr:L,D-transpeptidase family protein [Amylibacter sp. SFDW26]KAB7615606.1 L,D-transpeptidase family protein [Amylibacter sp. SFDW26]